MTEGESRRAPSRREEIVLEAARLFAERGYEGTSMADVADRVGLRKASLFHHFASKDELYEAALGTLIGSLSGAVFTAASAEGSFLDRLDALSEAVVDALAADPDVGRLLLREALDFGPVMKGALGHAVVDALATARAFARAGEDAGAFRLAMPADELITSLLGALLLPFAASDFMRLATGRSASDREFVEGRKTALRRLARLAVGAPLV